MTARSFPAMAIVFLMVASSYALPIERPLPSNEFGASTAVFTGRVVSVDLPDGSRSWIARRISFLWYRLGFSSPPPWPYSTTVKFEVLRSWKGVSEGTLTLPVDHCPFEFMIDEDYLIYAIGGSVLEAGPCLRSGAVANVKDDLAFLSTQPVTVFSAGSASYSSRFWYAAGFAGCVLLLVTVEWMIRRRRRADR